MKHGNYFKNEDTYISFINDADPGHYVSIYDDNILYDKVVINVVVLTNTTVWLTEDSSYVIINFNPVKQIAMYYTNPSNATSVKLRGTYFSGKQYKTYDFSDEGEEIYWAAAWGNVNITLENGVFAYIPEKEYPVWSKLVLNKTMLSGEELTINSIRVYPL